MAKFVSIPLLAIALVGLGLLAIGCSKSEALPPAAKDAIEQKAQTIYSDYYSGDVGFDQVMEVKFSRAWRAEDLPKELSGDEEAAQVWCVELAVSGVRSGEILTEKPVWVAIRDQAGGWSVQPLVMFSSRWPYESCGQAP